MKITIALSIGMALLPEIASAAGGFFQSCKNSWYMDGSKMVAECKRWNGSYMRSRQDMNLCMTNSYGTLKPGNG
ncbi:hypothetical protein NEMBOFW57_005682 [Staphylotrichum longicolle]|uniref:Cyanovirin-N domain-containing protein n=1 Tax=Staphylotrichum longicolle TaxID=669026 RepID=A0AAD4EXR5_9PEZI|nr:hypothetical protein NEMBOFW57_005682 [Staphylotrichum longicolle]